MNRRRCRRLNKNNNNNTDNDNVLNLNNNINIVHRSLIIISNNNNHVNDINDNIDKLKRCNCSMCKRKGTMVATIEKKDLKVIKGENKIKVYQFNTKVAKHHFCSECGIQTHNQRRSDPNTYGINMGCIDDIEVNELFKFKTFINDGQNHIKDRK